MKRIFASLISSAVILSFPGLSIAQQQQPVMVECRDLGGSDNFLGPNETLINGKACRPAGSAISVNIANPASVAGAAKLAPAKPSAEPPSTDASAPPAIPAAPPVAAVAAAPALPLILEDGTPVKLVLQENLSSANTVTGQTISFETVEDIMVDGVVVIPKMSTAWGTITQAQAKRRMGRGGKLDLNIDKVRLADGEKAMLRAVREGKGGGHAGAMTGAIVATSLVIWPAAPLFLLMHGKDVTIPKGTEINAFVNGDSKLDRNKFVH
jgi:hypothetical protein